MPALQAALTSGANAVYLGLKHFNARNGAKNFLPEELAKAVHLAHDANAKVYLTLNTDLCQRDLGMAARSLALAVKCGVDGVLVRDAALLLFMPYFPLLQFHFSTQAGVSSSAGVLASRELGLSRVVLAREMSLPEIEQANVGGIETEVFVQGALCFCASGRCLLSSWGGGRSGNRGSCASPCRVGWTNADGVEAHPMSMRDLCAIDWVEALRRAGVASLKIEGRLKAPAWVSKAVTLYRHAVDATEDADVIRQEAASLGNYTGRDLTDGYLRGDRNYMTAVSGRIAGCSGAAQPTEQENKPSGISISVESDESAGTLWNFSCGEAAYSYRIPPQRIANAKRAISVSVVLEMMQAAISSARRTAGEFSIAPEVDGRLLPKSASNGAVDALVTFIRSLGKEEDGLPRGMELPAEINEMLRTGKSARNSANMLSLGDRCDRIRVNVKLADKAKLRDGQTLVLECYPGSAEDVSAIMQTVQHFPTAIVALPQVVYENQLPFVRHLLTEVASCGNVVEVNSWDTLHLAKEANVRMEGGQGLAVLNSLAARKLAELGCESVTVACEIDKEQLEDLASASDVPLSLFVFGRPQLMVTRAILPELFRDGCMTDGRGISLITEHEGELTILRPKQPMDWRGVRNSKVRVAHLVADAFPFGTGDASPSDYTKTFLFNYDRRLR